MATWARAMERSLHAPGGFYPVGRGPGTDFRTAAVVAPDLLADAVVRLLERLPADAVRSVVEIGAGQGQLLAALADRLPASVELVGVERRPRPAGLVGCVTWTDRLPNRIRGLLMGVEWLDTVGVDVVVDGRTLEVEPSGREHPGSPVAPADRAWLDRWWPTGRRREVGVRRDAVWRDAVGRLEAGVALAVDYHHLRSARPLDGSLRGYRHGRVVVPRPDGDHDVTAAVALDACAAAAAEAFALPAGASVLTDQRTALRALGLPTGLPHRPPAGDGPAAARYAATLARGNRAAVLADPGGLGAFGWLQHAVGVPPEVLVGVSPEVLVGMQVPRVGP